MNDPVLEGYITLIREANPDLRQAYFRIEASRRQRDAAAGCYNPGLDMDGSYTRSRQSDKAGFAIPGTLTEHGLYSIGLTSSWEPDFFGRVKRQVQSARANLNASVKNCVRIIDEEGLAPREAAVKAMKQITGPVIATTLVLLSMFVPTGLIGGVSGRLYTQFAMTIATATVFSSIKRNNPTSRHP